MHHHHGRYYRHPNPNTVLHHVAVVDSWLRVAVIVIVIVAVSACEYGHFVSIIDQSMKTKAAATGIVTTINDAGLLLCPLCVGACRVLEEWSATSSVHAVSFIKSIQRPFEADLDGTKQ